MSTVTPNKSDSVDVLAHQAAVHPTTIVGSAIDCRTKRMASIFLYHAYIEATADTNPGKFLVQVRPDAGDGAVLKHWITVVELPARGTTPDSEAMTATEPAGETVLACASTTGFTVADGDSDLYIQDTTTLADSEWAKLRTFASNTSITLMDGLTTQKDNADVIWNDASRFVVTLDLDGIESFRVVWWHEGTTGANGHVKALAITHDSDNIAA
jgi:hypothetical protein